MLRKQKKLYTKFRARKNDFTKIDESKKSLTKDRKRFEFDENSSQFGGLSSEGPHLKQSKYGERKVYYLSPHEPKEYFGFEILNLIGFPTEKARIVAPISSDTENRTGIATKAIDDYIPIIAFIHGEFGPPLSVEEDYKLSEIYNRYQIDFKKQVIIDLNTKEEYKISGNLFASDIGAKLLADGDFQPEQGNVGLVRIGNRFHAFFIDKEKINFNGKTYEENIKETDLRVISTPMYDSATSDQKLFIVNQIVNALEQDSFTKIFTNSRVLATSEIDNAHIYAKDFITTASSVVHYYDKNKDLLFSFRQREQLISKLVDSILDEVSIEIDDTETLKVILAEDLRAPYYQHLFTNKNHITEADLENVGLKTAILKELEKELAALNIPPKEQSRSLKFSNKSPAFTRYTKSAASSYRPKKLNLSEDTTIDGPSQWPNLHHKKGESEIEAIENFQTFRLETSPFFTNKLSDTAPKYTGESKKKIVQRGFVVPSNPSETEDEELTANISVKENEEFLGFDKKYKTFTTSKLFAPTATVTAENNKKSVQRGFVVTSNPSETEAEELPANISVKEDEKSLGFEKTKEIQTRTTSKLFDLTATVTAENKKKIVQRGFAVPSTVPDKKV